MRSDSFFETHQETNSQIQPAVLALMKSYKFYIFLDREKHQPTNHLCNLQISLKLKGQRNSHGDKYHDYNKSIQLSFHDLQDEHQTIQALTQLKNNPSQNKTRLVVYGKQSTLIRLFQYAKKMSIKTENIPLVLYSNGFNNDLSTFLGWSYSTIGTIFTKSVVELEPEVRKWIRSPIQKIDTWNVDINAYEDIGQIYRYDTIKQQQFLDANKSISLGFLSHLSIGYHAKLNYQANNNYNEIGFFDKLKYKIQGFKKFCCVGSPNMKTATGVVNIKFIDEMGQEREILRQLKEFEEEDNKKYSKKRILTIVFANIDRYNGEKITNNQNFKMNDNKIQLITFQSMHESVKVASISGDIHMSLQSQKSVFIQVNNECIRIVNPKSIIIRKAQKRKVIINKQTLQC